MTVPPTDPPKSITGIWPAVLLLVVAVAMFFWAQTYSVRAARFPTIVAGVMVILCLFDIWSRSGLPGARIVETFGGTGFRRREMDHDPPLRRQAALLGWVLGCFALMAAAGILVASPVFAAAFVRVQGRRSLAAAATVGIAVFAFQFAVFEWLLDYELYRGLFFEKGGLAAW